jgi:hypothetical protein
VNYYDVLGVPQDATEGELRHAYLAKADRLRRERFAGAPGNVMAALEQASAVVDQAWRTLSDDALRAAYDRDLDRAADSRRAGAERIWALERALGWSLSPAFGLEPSETEPVAPIEAAGSGRAEAADGAQGSGLAGPTSVPSERGDVSFPLASLEILANWLGGHPRASRTVSVPNVRGMRASEAFYAVAQADLEINFVRLTENPGAGDGVVIDQDPPPGTVVRRHSRLTVHVVHPPVESGISLS